MSSNKYAVLLTAVILLSGCTQNTAGQADIIDIESIQSRDSKYELYECVPTVLERETNASSRLEYPVHEPLFFRESGGRLKGIYVTNGATVKSGDVLAEIVFDDGTLTSEINEREIRYEADSAAILAEQDRRMSEINDIGKQIAALTMSSQKANDGRTSAVKNEIRILELQIKKAESDYHFYIYDSERRLNEQKIELDELKENLQGEVITAPYDGVITDIRLYSPGKIIEPWEYIMFIYDPAAYVFTISSDAASVRYNMEVEIVVPRTGSYKGRIISDPSALDSGESTLTYLVVFDEEPPPYSDIARKIISIKCKNIYLDGVIAIPNKGIRNEEAKKYVLVLEDNMVKKRYVQQGIFTSELTQILAGVNLGDKIVLN